MKNVFNVKMIRTDENLDQNIAQKQPFNKRLSEPCLKPLQKEFIPYYLFMPVEIWYLLFLR